MNSKHCFLLLGLLCMANITYAQTDIINLALCKTKYPNENALMLKNYTDAEVKIEKGVPVVYSSTYEEKLLLTDAAIQAWSKDDISFSALNKLVKWEAFTLLPEGDSYKKIPVKSIMDITEQDGGIFYDDDVVRQFMYPSVASGAKLVKAYTIKFTDPHLYGKFIFGDFLNQENVRFSITFPDNVKISHKYYGPDTDLIKFTETKKNSKTTYTWELNNYNKYKFENGVKSILKYLPHVFINIESYEVDGKTVQVMSNLQDQYTWNYNFIKDINKEGNDHIKQFADSLVRNYSTEKEKVNALYQFVQSNIRYVAFEDGYGGYIPRDANLVLSRKYGDCKDKSNLLNELLRSQGFNSSMAWVGTRILPYEYGKVIGTSLNNHMIVAYTDPVGKLHFLDATDEFLPMHIPSSETQGKQAMIAVDSLNYKIETVPVVSKELNYEVDSIQIKVKENIIEANARYIMKGYVGQKYRIRIAALNNEKKEEAISYMFRIGSNKFKLISYSHSDLHAVDEALDLRFKFELPDYLVKQENEIYLNPFLDRSLLLDKIDMDKRKCGFDTQFTVNSHRIYQIEIPEGYNLKSSISDCDYQTPYGQFKVIVKQQGRTIYVDEHIVLDSLFIPLQDLENWNKIISTASKAYSNVFVFEKN